MENVLRNFRIRFKDKNLDDKKPDYLQKIYEKNSATGNYVIQVALDKYTDIFNDWDNSPFKKRDMDPDLAEFLENCFDEIPKEDGLDICFYLSKEIQDVKREEVLISGIKTYYSFYLHEAMKSAKEKYRSMIEYMAASFSLLAVSVFLNINFGKDIMMGTIQQCFNVGGWMFLWEAFSMFFFRRRTVLSEISKYQRFLKSMIFFKYHTDNVD